MWSVADMTAVDINIEVISWTTPKGRTSSKTPNNALLILVINVFSRTALKTLVVSSISSRVDTHLRKLRDAPAARLYTSVIIPC